MNKTLLELTKEKQDRHNRLVQARNATAKLAKMLETARDTEANCQKNFDDADEAVRLANKAMK